MNVFKGIFFALWFTLSITSNATNYFISNSGNDLNDGKSVGSAFASVTKATGIVSAGDTIFIRSGIYYMSSGKTGVTRGGNSSKRACMWVYPGDERPILDFSAQPIGTDYGMNFRSSYWHVKGIRFRRAGGSGVCITKGTVTSAGVYNVFEFCDFYENRGEGMVLDEGCNNNLILHCDAYLNADYVSGSTTYTGGNADGFAPKLAVGTNNKFVGCRSWRNSDDGWDGYLKTTADDMTTILENCWTWGNGYLKDGTTTTNSMNGNGFKMGGSDAKTLRHNFIVKNCLSFYNKSKGYDQNSSAGSLTLYNCTAYKNKSNNYYFNSSGVTFPADKVFTVKNCVGDNSTVPSFRSGSILANNNWSATAVDFMSIDTIGISGPRKADGSLPDLAFMHLQTAPKSMLIDAGVDLGMPFNGSAPDLGCFETAGIPLSNNQLYKATTLVYFENNREITLRLQSEQNQRIEIKVFSAMGVLLESFSNEAFTGIQEFKLGRSLNPGTYFCTLRAGGKQQTQKISVR